MSRPVSIPLQRCCLTHYDWTTLARHLLDDFGGVPSRSIVDELRQAKRAGDFFHLDPADALDCAELIVRYRVASATEQCSQPVSRPNRGRVRA